jgi:putative tryptophan/tyrosine transport system substrate-binding protein
MKKAASTLFISATLILTPVYLAYAQKQATIPRIGVLLLGAPPNANLDAFIQGLQELGYIEGKNIFVEYRFAEGFPRNGRRIKNCSILCRNEHRK